MEKKIILKSTGEPVKVGDYITSKSKKKTSFGVIESETSYLVTEATLPILVANGVLEYVKESTKASSVNEDLTYYVTLLSTKTHKSLEEVVDWLDALNTINPAVVLSLLLKLISEEFLKADKKETYNGKYYYISISDGNIYSLDKLPNNPKATSYTSLFKSKANAEVAKRILKEQFKLMYA